MAKLIFSMDGAFLGEYPLDKERMTIGRRPASDIYIDNLGVSGDHAAIITIGDDSFLEDLGSTNGTLVNGKPIKKHVLQHADMIEFGNCQLKYINEAAVTAARGSDPGHFEETMILQSPAENAAASVQAPASMPAQASSASPTAEAAIVGHVRVLNGPSTGKQLVLNKALTTLGKPGMQVAVITRRPHGYFITHVEGQHHPKVNDKSVGAQAHALNDHDMIELAGVKMEFYLSKA